MWLFYYFTFERNYDVLKWKSPCILLKTRVFFVPFILSERSCCNICVLSQCIAYWIHFQNIYTYAITLFCLFSKSFQCMVKEKKQLKQSKILTVRKDSKFLRFILWIKYASLCLRERPAVNYSRIRELIWSVYPHICSLSGIKRLKEILSLYGKIRVRENPYSGIFFTVIRWVILRESTSQ